MEWNLCIGKRQEYRTEEDVDVIYAAFKEMKAFEHFPAAVVTDLCRYAEYERLPSKVTLFHQGDIGSHWYAVISGTLDVCLISPDSPEENVSICSISEGDTFGESIIFGGKRSASVVTLEPCELLCVEANYMKQLYKMASFIDILVKFVSSYSHGEKKTLFDLMNNCVYNNLYL